MICVWEQTDGPSMFLLTPVQILSQIKDATWLLQTEYFLDQAYFLFSASSTFKSFPVLSPLVASFPQKPPLPLYPIPTFIMCHFDPSFSSKWIHLHPFFLKFPESLSHFYHMSGRLGFVWLLPRFGSSPSQAPLVWLTFWFVEQSQLEMDHFSGLN